MLDFQGHFYLPHPSSHNLTGPFLVTFLPVDIEVHVNAHLTSFHILRITYLGELTDDPYLVNKGEKVSCYVHKY